MPSQKSLLLSEKRRSSSMTNKQPKKVTLLVIFLSQNVNLTDAYIAAEDLARKNEGEFHGIFLYELPTRQPIVCNNLNFTVPIDFVQTLIDALLIRLNLPKNQVQYQITEAPATIEKPLPEGMIK
jgi:hypothetical protein